MDYLSRLKRITELEMSSFVQGLTMPEELEPKPKTQLPPYNTNRREFRIIDYIPHRRKRGRDWWARCPSCALRRRDTSGDNLAISFAEPRRYRCWAGCTKELVREPLGGPIRTQEANHIWRL